MPSSSLAKHLYDDTLTLSDGTATAVSLVIPLTVGDFSLSGLSETQRNTVVYETRGVAGPPRHTTRLFPSLSFSAHLPGFTGTSMLMDFLLKRGSYSGNKSTSATEVYTLDLIFSMEGSNHGDSADHTCTITDIAFTSVDIAEGEPNTVSVSGTVYGTVTFT